MAHLLSSKKTNVKSKKQGIIRKTYALIEEDLKNIEIIKEKLLDKRIVLNDSHILRLSLMIVAERGDDKLESYSKKLTKLVAGRPKES